MAHETYYEPLEAAIEAVIGAALFIVYRCRLENARPEPVFK